MSPEFKIWYPAPPKQRGRVMLFCLPPGAAGASIYREWHKLLSPEIEVWAPQLPGREQRIMEPAIADMKVLAPLVTAAMRACIDRPYAIFGHSMGGLIGYEVIDRLRLNGSDAPLCFIPSAIWPPEHIDPDPWQGLSREAMVAKMAAHEGYPPELLANDDWLDLMLPTIRADGALTESWISQVERIACPITAIAGAKDTRVPSATLDGWAKRTTATFEKVTIDGRHDFINTQRSELCAVVERAVLASARLRR